MKIVKASSEQTIEIKPLHIVKTQIRIVGDSPLIEHAWSDKAKMMMLEKQTKVTKTKGHDIRNPIEDFINSMYWISGKPNEYTEDAYMRAIANGARFGFPVTAIKQSGISAALRLGWVKNKMSLRGAFYIDADDNGLAEIKSDVPVMREDMVKIGMGTADLRYRGQFNNWSILLNISYCTNGEFTLEQILNIINAGGYSCGIGEWRPERDGQNGMFHVEGV